MSFRDAIAHTLDPVSVMCPEYCISFWTMIGTWVASAGTVAAVLVSLWLARRASTKLMVRAGLRVILGGGMPRTEHLVIEIANVGERDATIEGLGWKSAPWIKHQGFQVLDDTPVSPRLPYRLPAGERVSIPIRLRSRGHDWLREFHRDFLGSRPKLAVHFVRVQVWTPSGLMFTARVEAALRRRMVQAGPAPPDTPELDK